MPRFKSIILHQNIPKIKLFLEKKMQNFQALGGLPPDPQNNPHCESLATRLHYTQWLYPRRLNSNNMPLDVA